MTQGITDSRCLTPYLKSLYKGGERFEFGQNRL